jgi:tol-pal system protein YbgF
VRVKSIPTAHRTRARERSGRWPDAAVAVVVILTFGLTGGCALGGRGAKPADETKAAAPDSPAALREDVDRLRADLADLRARLEGAQRAGTDHADRVAQETRAEFDAVQKAMEASSRHDLQRQVEVLDAQARRIDLMEKRVTELGQALRRVELSLSGIEGQLARVLDGAAAPPSGARSGSPARSASATPASRPAEESPPSASAPDSAMSTAAAGAGLTPPAMLGTGRAVKSAAPPTPAAPAPARETKVDPPRADETSPAPKRTDAMPRAMPPPGPAPGDAARAAKAAPPAGSTTAAPRPAAATPPRTAKTDTPGAGAPTARALFDRAMESWNKGEQGQAVLEFDELVQTFPSDPLAASAQFRIGEAYYAARDFERAAVEYRKAVDLAPKGKDTPQALLRLGLAFRAQKRESDARQAWNQLVRDFPESEATEEARRALRGR